MLVQEGKEGHAAFPGLVVDVATFQAGLFQLSYSLVFSAHGLQV